MPRIRFTANPKLPRDLAHLDYRQGTEVDLPSDQADRWLRRGVAEIVPDAKPEPEPAASEPMPEAIEIPEDWQEQHHMARIALARRIAPDAVIESAAAADEMIGAEVERRAAA